MAAHSGIGMTQYIKKFIENKAGPFKGEELWDNIKDEDCIKNSNGLTPKATVFAILRNRLVEQKMVRIFQIDGETYYQDYDLPEFDKRDLIINKLRAQMDEMKAKNEELMAKNEELTADSKSLNELRGLLKNIMQTDK
jgi:uncharacterized protein involved in exopolysaccharide biosynthesis